MRDSSKIKEAKGSILYSVMAIPTDWSWKDASIIMNPDDAAADFKNLCIYLRTYSSVGHVV